MEKEAEMLERGQQKILSKAHPPTASEAAMCDLPSDLKGADACQVWLVSPRQGAAALPQKNSATN